MQWIHELRRHTGNLEPLRYVARLPEAAGRTPGVKYPAILFLHGSGERDVPLQSLSNRTVFAYAKTHTNFPFIALAPQCPQGQWWDAPALDDWFAEAMAQYPIDPDRVYLTGLSMGGLGTWTWATEHPDRFAVVVPICGGGDPQDVERLKDLPVWNFHGGKDPTVPLRLSDEMITALRAVHGRVLYTVYPDGPHNVWDTVYGTDELYAWLLRQTRGRPEQPPATVLGSAPTDKRPLAGGTKP